MLCTPWKAVVEALKSENVRYIFGLPGDTRHLIMDLASAPDVEFVLMRHEASAVAAAYAYARITGKPGICFASAGPGIGNMVSSLLEANTGCLPVIALALGVDNKTDGMGAFQELDAQALMRPVTKWCTRLTDPSKIAWTMQRAFTLATNGKPGAIFIEIPMDIGLNTAEVPSYRPYLGRQLTRPAPDQVKSAANLFQTAEFPLVLCGSGAVYSGAYDQVQKLAEKVGAPVFTTPGGRGIISENHPLSMGQVGLYFTDVGMSYYNKSDLILSVGSRLEAFSTGSWEFFPDNAKLIQLDIDSDTIALNWRPDVPLVGDAAISLEDILTEISTKDINSVARDERLALIHSSKRKYFQQIELEADMLVSPIRPPTVLAAINKIFGENIILVNENGATDLWCYYWPYYRVMNIGDCVPMAEQTNMGMGVIGTIGAKLAKPDKKVVCVTGDGAMQMGMMELATAAELKCGVTWVIMNNRCLGWPQFQQVLKDHPPTGTRFKVSPDFAALAKSQDCWGVNIQEPQDVEKALSEALKVNAEGIPAVVNIQIAKHDYPSNFVEIHRKRYGL